MLPNLLVIGGLKCGTTSLHQYLGSHPDVEMSEHKELNFFVRPGDSRVRAGNWDRGVDWYRSWFRGPASVRGESSHHYSAYPLVRGVPERAAELVPEAKLIYLVRDPIDRIVAHHGEWARYGISHGSLDATIEHALLGPRENTLTCRSMYFMQLERWLERFPAERALVVDLHEIRDRPGEAMSRIFRFLGVDEAFESPLFARSVNPSSERRMPRAYAGRAERLLLELGNRAQLERRRKPLPGPVRAGARIVRQRLLLGPPRQPPAIDPGLRERLAEVLAPDVDRLRRHTGQAFSSWSI